MDFTLNTYHNLLKAIMDAGYAIQSFEDFIQKPKENVVVLRHDVDRLPKNALKMALIENEMGCKASYYFRVIPHVFDEKIIEQCVALGHEVSYHYEDMTICNGDVDKSFEHFKEKLELFRKYYPAKTICMHGSPLTKWDNRDLWKKYDYRDLGVIAEPYFDVDYQKVFYITDTGRQWQNDSSNVRDKVNSGYDISIHISDHLMKLFQNGSLPNQVIINTHPHRWFDFGPGWVKELVMQNVKNVAKAILIKIRK